MATDKREDGGVGNRWLGWCVTRGERCCLVRVKEEREVKDQKVQWIDRTDSELIASGE